MLRSSLKRSPQNPRLLATWTLSFALCSGPVTAGCGVIARVDLPSDGSAADWGDGEDEQHSPDDAFPFDLRGSLPGKAQAFVLEDEVDRLVRRSDDEVIAFGRDVLYAADDSPVVAEKGFWIECLNERKGLRWKRWLRSEPSTSWSFVDGHVLVDQRGHIWFAGHFSGELTIGDTTVTSVVDPHGPEENPWYPNPSLDLVLVELDENGALLRVNTFGGVGDQSVAAAAFGPDGALVLAVELYGKMSVGVPELTSSRGALDYDLTFLHVNQEGDVESYSQYPQKNLRVKELEIGDDGSLILLGHRTGSAPEVSLGAFSVDFGQRAWVLSLGPEGLVNWSRTLDRALLGALEVDDSGNVLVLSGGHATADPNEVSLSGLVKLSPIGQPLFALALGGTSDDYISAFTTLPDDSIVLTGAYYENIDLGGGPLFVQDEISLVPDVVTARLDAQGRHVWSASTGGVGYDYGIAVVAVRKDRIALLGAFDSAIDWGRGPVTGPGERYVTWLTP